MEGELPGLESPSHHANDLRVLQVIVGYGGWFHSVQDLEYIATNCQSLKRLTLRLGDLCRIVDSLTVLKRFDLSFL
jgi:hypothetical protein